LVFQSSKKRNAIRVLAKAMTAWPDPKIKCGFIEYANRSLIFNQEAMTQFNVSVIANVSRRAIPWRLGGKKSLRKAMQIPLMRDNVARC